MKIFRFRLEKVRQVRETQRRQSQVRFLESRRRLAEQNKHLAEVMSEEERAAEMYSDSARGETRSDDLLAARHYFSVAEQQVVGQQKNVATAEQKVEERRTDLVEKTRDKEILDRLRERRLAEYTIWAQREKQKQIDETARHNYFRKRKTAK